MKKPNPTVAILHGLGEGTRTSSGLRRVLTQKGFNVTMNAAQADIIIAHSGGFLSLPKNTTDKVVLLIAPSNGYRFKSLVLTQLQKVSIDAWYCVRHGRLLWWLRKSFWNTLYLLSAPEHTWRMFTKARQNGKKLPSIQAKRIDVILYHNDPWSWHFDHSSLAKLSSATLISHPGIHDDIWIDPKSYLAVLQYLYEA